MQIFFTLTNKWNTVGKISRRVSLVHYPKPEELAKPSFGSLTPSSKKSAGNSLLTYVFFADRTFLLLAKLGRILHCRLLVELGVFHGWQFNLVTAWFSVEVLIIITDQQRKKTSLVQLYYHLCWKPLGILPSWFMFSVLVKKKLLFYPKKSRYTKKIRSMDIGQKCP